LTLHCSSDIKVPVLVLIFVTWVVVDITVTHRARFSKLLKTIFWKSWENDRFTKISGKRYDSADFQNFLRKSEIKVTKKLRKHRKIFGILKF